MEEKQSETEVNQVYAVKEFAPTRIVCVAVTTFYCSMWAKKLTQKEMMGGNANHYLSFHINVLMVL